MGGRGCEVWGRLGGEFWWRLGREAVRGFGFFQGDIEKHAQGFGVRRKIFEKKNRPKPEPFDRWGVKDSKKNGVKRPIYIYKYNYYFLYIYRALFVPSRPLPHLHLTLQPKPKPNPRHP